MNEKNLKNQILFAEPVIEEKPTISANKIAASSL